MVTKVQDIFFRKRNTTAQYKRKKKEACKPEKKKKQSAKNAKEIFIGDKTCHVRAWRISIDTGDYVYNAWLYPLNHFIGTEHCHINFHEENYLVLELRNNLARMLYVWVR